ncbi:MAG: RsmB/NOP family class I SAM-dependent RNA methyltransferase, partial [Candidatus Thorarchaeota archaeon]
MSRRQIRDRAKVLAQEYGYLQYMIERYLSLWGEEETLRFLEACEEPVRTSIRMNTLKASVEQTAARLNEKG